MIFEILKRNTLPNGICNPDPIGSEYSHDPKLWNPKNARVSNSAKEILSFRRNADARV